LSDLGWQRFVSRLRDGDDDDKDKKNRTLAFRKQGYILIVYVGESPVKEFRTHVQFMVTALAHELPAPPNATKVEFDDANWKMRCEVPGDLKEAAEFYQKAMPAAGYKALSSEEPRPAYWNLRFGTDS